MKNNQFLEGLSTQMSAEFNSKMPQTMSENGIEVYAILNDYPTLKNEFLDVLTNKVVKSKFYDKVFQNKLKMFHRGEMPFGSSIEDVFVEMANKKGFREHFKEGGSIENDLIGVEKSKVHVKYHSKNFEYKYKVTISELQLKTAFYSSDGLSRMVSELLATLTRGAYFDEYEDMRNMLSYVCEGKALVLDETTGLPKPTVLTAQDVTQPIKTVTIQNFATNPKILSETVRGLAGRMEFPSTEYNMAGVKQHSNPSDLIFLCEPETVAKIDVNVLAEAFNVSKADLQTRTVTVDKMPTSFVPTIGGSPATKKCIGMLIDRDFLQMYDTLLTMKKFDNGANLTVNNFLHKHGMLYNCYFANAVAILEG